MDEKRDKNQLFQTSDLPKLCRSCLCEVHRNYFSLGGFYLERKVLDIYKNVTSLEISTKDNLPKKLCATCYDQIIKFDLFKNRILESEKRLTEFVNDIFVKSNEKVANLYKSGFSNIKSNGKNDSYKENDESGDAFHDESDSEDEDFLFNKLNKNDDEIEQKHNNKTEDKEDNSSTINLNDIKDTEWDQSCEEAIPQNLEELPKVKQTKRIRKKEKSEAGLGEKKKSRRRREPCTECGKFLLAYKMDSHMRTHTKEKPYGCEKCGACFSEKSNLNRHLKTHGNERPHKCEICGKGFLRPSSRAMHEVTAHNTERNVLCPICNKGFKHRTFLTKHMLNIHKTNEKIKVEGPGYPCPICGNLYRTKSSLTVHRMKHEQPRAFLCNICGNGFSTKAVMENHQKVHTGEKNFSCDICLKKFRFITTLKTHVLVHSGEKPLSCHICHKQFRQHSHLSTHIKGQHSAERPYQCNFCDKSFKVSCNLTVHTRIHTGETPYHCDICQKGFYDSCRMKKHRKSHFCSKQPPCSLG